MKSLKRILFSIIAILILATISAYAAEPELQISGEIEAKAGETKTLTVKLVSEEDIGVISGKIVGDDNIANIEITGKNDWNKLAENKGSFNLVKAQGGKTEDVLEIKYTLKEEATGKAVITFSNIELATLDYQSKTLANITKEITIPVESEPVVTLTKIEITKAPTKVTYKAGETFSKTGMEITAKYSDGTSKVIKNYTYTPNGALSENDKKIVISYTENGVTKTVDQAITVEKQVVINNNNNNQQQQQPQQQQQQQQQQVQQNPITVTTGNQNAQKDTTTANKELSKAGIESFTFYAIIVVVATGIVFYIKYYKMKDVK